MSRPGSMRVPTEAEATEPTAHRMLAELVLSDSRMNPTAFDGTETVEAVEVTETLFTEPF